MAMERIEVRGSGKLLYRGPAEVTCGWRGRIHQWEALIDAPGIGRQISSRRQGPVLVRRRGEPPVDAFVAAPATRGPNTKGVLLRGTGPCPAGHRG